MAAFKYFGFININQSTEFDKFFKPGIPAPHHGIYRCQGCGGEIASAKFQPLPTQVHHPHSQEKPPILWRLVVWAAEAAPPVKEEVGAAAEATGAADEA